jgi:hypothetical protein
VTRPRITIGRLMIVVALLGFHLAIVCDGPSVFGLDGLEVGLLPGVTTLTVRLFWGGHNRERSGPFGRGFIASLAVAIGVYLVACLAIPEFVRGPIVYYVNEIEPYVMDADLVLQYWLSLEIQGLIIGLPLLLFALGVGLLTKMVECAWGSPSPWPDAGLEASRDDTLESRGS